MKKNLKAKSLSRLFFISFIFLQIVLLILSPFKESPKNSNSIEKNNIFANAQALEYIQDETSNLKAIPVQLNQYAYDMNILSTPTTEKTTKKKQTYVSNYDHFIGMNCTEDSVEKDCGGLEALVCLDGKCSFCTNSTQCSDQVHSLFSCHFVGSFKPYVGGVCEHKNLFEYISYLDILATVFCFLGGVLSAASGTGGGGLFVPLLHVAGQFSASMSIPMSTLMIFGAGLVNISVLAFKRHPHADRPLIDYDIALMMEPPTLLGTIIGVFFNLMFPNWLITVLVIIVLVITSIVMVRNGYKRFLREQEEALQKASHHHEDTTNIPNNQIPVTTDYEQLEGQEEEEEANLVTDPFLVSAAIDVDRRHDEEHRIQQQQQHEEQLLHNQQEQHTDNDTILLTEHHQNNNQHDSTDDDNKSTDGLMGGGKSSHQHELQRIYESERSTPIGKVIVLLLCWLTIFVLSLMKGGHGSPSIVGVERCSVGYWILTAMSFPVLGAMTLFVAVYLLKTHKKKVNLNYQFVEGDVHWNAYNVTIYPVACVGAGILAALLGIGGGMVKSPLLLILGSDPVASQATTSFMILFTSSISTAQYLIAGALPLDYGIWFAVCGILSGIFGQLLLDYCIERSGRRSIMVFIVAVVTIIAAFLMGGAGIYDIVKDVQKGVYMGFKSPCL